MILNEFLVVVNFGNNFYKFRFWQQKSPDAKTSGLEVQSAYLVQELYHYLYFISA